MTFPQFKQNSIIVSMFKRLDADAALTSSATMSDLLHLLHNGHDNERDNDWEFKFYEHAEALYPSLDFREKLVLEAILTSCYFAGLADKLSNGNAWSRLADLISKDRNGEYIDTIYVCLRVDVT